MVSKKAKAKSKSKPKSETKTVDVTLSEAAKAAAPASIPKDDPKPGAPTTEAKKVTKAKAPKKPPKPKIENARVAYVVRLSKTALKDHKEAFPSVDLVVTAFVSGEIKEQEAVESINKIVQDARAA